MMTPFVDAREVVGRIRHKYLSEEWKAACDEMGYDYVIYHINKSCGHYSRIIFSKNILARAKFITRAEQAKCRACFRGAKKSIDATNSAH